MTEQEEREEKQKDQNSPLDFNIAPKHRNKLIARSVLAMYFCEYLLAQRRDIKCGVPTVTVAFILPYLWALYDITYSLCGVIHKNVFYGVFSQASLLLQLPLQPQEKENQKMILKNT